MVWGFPATGSLLGIFSLLNLARKLAVSSSSPNLPSHSPSLATASCPSYSPASPFPLCPFFLCSVTKSYKSCLLSILFLYPHLRTCLLILEKGEGKERKNNWLPLLVPQPETEPATLGTHPEQESNSRPFGLQCNAQPTQPHQPGFS